MSGAPERGCLPAFSGWELGWHLRGPPPTTQQPALGMAFGLPAPHHPPEAGPRLRQSPYSSGSSSSGAGRIWSTPHLPDGTQQPLRAGRRRRWRLPSKLLLGWLAVAAATYIRAVILGQVLPFGWGELRPVVWPLREPSRRANLLPLTVLDQSPDACAQASHLSYQAAAGLPACCAVWYTLDFVCAAALTQDSLLRYHIAFIGSS